MWEKVFGFGEKHDSTETIFEREAGFVIVKGFIDDLQLSDVLSVFESVCSRTIDYQTQVAGFLGLVWSVGKE